MLVHLLECSRFWLQTRCNEQIRISSPGTKPLPSISKWYENQHAESPASFPARNSQKNASNLPPFVFDSFDMLRQDIAHTCGVIPPSINGIPSETFAKKCYAQTPWFAHEQSDVKTYDYVSTTATSNKRDKRKSAGEMSMALRLGMRTVPLLGFIKRLHTRYQYPTPLEQFIIPQLEFHLEFTCRYQIFHPHGTIKFSTPMGQSIMIMMIIIIIIRASSSSRQSMRSCRISGVLTVDLSLVKHWVQIAEGNH